MAENTNSQSLVVLGAGPGGYTAAFLAADLGMKVTLIGQDVNPGGVCLYRGCIPSKALLHAARVLREAEEAQTIGITFDKPTIDLDQLRTWKNSVVEKLTGGLGGLNKRREITYVQGTAAFTSCNSLTVDKPDGSKEDIQFDTCILATGSSPATLPHAPNSEHVWDSTDALELKEIPKSLLVVGGGYIGLELGSVYAQLGSRVSVVEMLPGLMPGADRDLVSIFTRRSGKLFQNIHLSSKLLSIKEGENGLIVEIETKSGDVIEETYSKILVSIGRKPNTQNIGLENTKVELDERGFVKADNQLRTTDPAIYAIGDVIGGPLLAHKASHEGRVAVENIAGHDVTFDPKAIPGVVYTDPEIAFTGLTETEAKEKGMNIQVMKFPWAASGRAITMDYTEGSTKLIVDPETQKVLGMGMAGLGAGDMITEGTLAIEKGITAKELAKIIHPHPTLSETIMESAEMFEGTCTHIYRPKRR